MLWKTLMIISYRALLFPSFARLAVAALGVRCDACLLERELVPLTPGTQIPPTLVDLQDQFVNLQNQVNEGVPGSPGFDDSVNKLDAVQANLELGIQGVATLVDPSHALPSTPISSSSGSKFDSTVASPSATSTPSRLSIILPFPSFPTNTLIPVVTAAPPLGTSTTSPTLPPRTSETSSSSVSVSPSLALSPGGRKKALHGSSVSTAASPRRTHSKKSAKKTVSSGSAPFLPRRMKIRILCIVICTAVFGELPFL